jgi:hypothetical protein
MMLTVVGLTSCLQDIVEFQKEKQGRLNELPAVVNLRLHQIQCMDQGKPLSDLSGMLVFSQQQLIRLTQRMKVSRWQPRQLVDCVEHVDLMCLLLTAYS